MKFITGGIQGHEQQRLAGVFPMPWARLHPKPLGERAPNQDRKDGIFGQVRAFANGNNHFMNSGGLEMRKQPEQEGLNDP